jgi:hypothetical protein
MMVLFKQISILRVIMDPVQQLLLVMNTLK